MTESSSESGPSKSEATPQEIFDKSLSRLNDLLDSGEDIPAYVLGQMLTTVARVKEKDEAPPPSQETDALASLESLPAERQRELLLFERARLAGQLQSIEERLANLDGEEHA